MKRKWISLACSVWLWATSAEVAELFIEAESFVSKGGWVTDQQFMDQMGYPYLMAHGMDEPVADASTRVIFPQTGVYDVYVRTYNWTSPWKKIEGPGKFQLAINSTASCTG
jgi:hypothetical protein